MTVKNFNYFCAGFSLGIAILCATAGQPWLVLVNLLAFGLNINMAMPSRGN